MTNEYTEAAIMLTLIEGQINKLDKRMFMAFVCTMVQVWCEKHDADMAELTGDILDVIFKKNMMQN